MSTLPLESTNAIQPNVPYCLGIDEAGRGPVLGPMVYGCCFCPVADKTAIAKMGFTDSKQLTEQQRSNLFTKIQNSTQLGFAVNVLSPQYMSHSMLRINKYNLNFISHDAAIHLIKKTLAKGVKLDEVYVDTVGSASKYQAKLANLFPSIKTIVVQSKADSVYPIVSAASICAKVVRDDLLKKWEFDEIGPSFSKTLGSGYPGDPVTKKWLKTNLDPVFGYPSIIRFSWKTCDKLLDENATRVTWKGGNEEDEEEELFHKGSVKKKKSPRKGAGIISDPNKKLKPTGLKDRYRYHFVAR